MKGRSTMKSSHAALARRKVHEAVEKLVEALKDYLADESADYWKKRLAEDFIMIVEQWHDRITTLWRARSKL